MYLDITVKFVFKGRLNVVDLCGECWLTAEGAPHRDTPTVAGWVPLDQCHDAVNTEGMTTCEHTPLSVRVCVCV